MNPEEFLKNRRILFVLPCLELGGAERQALNFAEYLKAIGADVHVWGHPPVGLVASRCDDLGIPWKDMPTIWPCRKKNIPRIPIRFFRWVRQLRKLNPDVILPYCPHPCLAAGLTWRLSRAKVCIWGQRCSHDLRADWVEKFVFNRVSAAICNAKHEVKYLNSVFGKSQVPIHVVYNGLAMKQPVSTRQEWRKKMNINEGDRVAVMLANFRPAQKDHVTLLRGWKDIMDKCSGLIPRYHLVLAGAERDDFEKVRARAHQLNLADSVHFLGQVTDVSGLLNACDVGVLLSRIEGLPNAILEYMTCGLPVVASDHAANRELFGEDREQPLCREKSSEDVAGYLLKFLSNGELSTRVGSRNQTRALSEFAIDKMCNSMGEIVANALSGS